MFDNIGGKIKGLAAVVCWFGIFGSIIAAIAFFVKANDSWRNEELYTMLGFVFLFAGPLFSWISSLFIYGFGELIDKTKQIYMQVAGYNTMSHEEVERIERIEKLREHGLINEEEYLNAIQNKSEEST